MIFDLALILLFFITFKLYDIYAATSVIIIGAILQVLWTRYHKKHFDKKQLAILGVVLVFGGMTLYFHNPIFIKWKPTIVFWIMGVALFISHFVGQQTLVQRMMAPLLEGKVLPVGIWKKLNIAWIVFFLSLGVINVVIAYTSSTETWVNFKLYGVFSALLIFAVGQSVYLARFFTADK